MSIKNILNNVTLSIGVVFILLFHTHTSSAQNTDSIVAGLHIELDPVVFKTVKEGWDLQAFIQRMKEDTTFYQAFLGLKTITYTSDNSIYFWDKKNDTLSFLENRTNQSVQGNCRTLVVSHQKHSANFFNKKGAPNMLTSSLFQNLFFREVNNECRTANTPQSSKSGQFDKQKEQIKQLIFDPGQKVQGVPFVGQKASIFEPDIARKYDFKLSFSTINNIPCYLFEATPKEAFKNDVVYNQLSTWFQESDYSIVARDYSLSYNTLVYDFDVDMKVRLEKVGERLLPSSILYKGNWHVTSKKRERATFEILFDY